MRLFEYYFERMELALVKKGSDSFRRSPQSPPLFLTHFARCGVEHSTTIDLRDLEIEFYSDQSIRVFFRPAALDNEQRFLISYLNFFEQEIEVKDYSLTVSMGGYAVDTDFTPFLFESIDAFKALITILEDKIPHEMHTDLVTLLAFIRANTTEVQNHVLEEHGFFTGKTNEYFHHLFALVRYQSEGKSGDSCHYQRLSGKRILIQPLEYKQAIKIQDVTESGLVEEFYLVRNKSHGGFRLLNSYNQAPFKAYDRSIKQKYELVYEELLPYAYLDIHDDGLGDPDCPLFKKTNNHWELTRHSIPVLLIIPIKEFDWLISHTIINPYQVDYERRSLIEHVLRNDLADCLGTLLSYGIERFAARYTLPTIYKSIYERVRKVSSGQLQEHPELSKMWSYFQPTLRKMPPTFNTQTSTQMRLISNPQYIQSMFFSSYKTQEPMELETLFKSASLLKSEEREQFLSLVEESFNSLLTEQDKQEFAARVASMAQPLSQEEAMELWCSFIESRFNCTLSPDKKDTFLKLMTTAERADFHSLIHCLSNEKERDQFWNLVDKSIVRFSFAKELIGTNKFVELVYKQFHILIGDELVITKKLIAGFIHELLIVPDDAMKKNKHFIWHIALIAKTAFIPTPPGLIPFLVLKGPLSLGLKYKVSIICFNLNTNSHSFVEPLDDYFPKHRSPQKDKFVAKLIHAIHGKDVIIHQDGMAYYIQDCIQAKNLAPSAPLSGHLYSKFNGTADGEEEPKAKYRAVPTFFSASRRENREKLNKRAPHGAHLEKLSTALEPIILPLISEYQMPLAKL